MEYVTQLFILILELKTPINYNITNKHTLMQTPKNILICYVTTFILGTISTCIKPILTYIGKYYWCDIRVIYYTTNVPTSISIGYKFY